MLDKADQLVNFTETSDDVGSVYEGANDSML